MNSCRWSCECTESSILFHVMDMVFQPTQVLNPGVNYRRVAIAGRCAHIVEDIILLCRAELETFWVWPGLRSGGGLELGSLTKRGAHQSNQGCLQHTIQKLINYNLNCM